MSKTCLECRNGEKFETSFSMAFQPIIDVAAQKVFAHEALVRGPAGEGAWSVLSTVDETNRYAFDQQCRVKAIELASSLYGQDDNVSLSINFMPNAVYEPRACIRLTLAAAMRTKFPTKNIIFEFTENEQLDTAHLFNILRTYRDMGFRTAIDDFGAGHAGLALLAEFQPDIAKLDMALIRGIDTDTARQKIVKHTVAMLDDLGVTPLCEGIETVGELRVLADLGVKLMQGYLIARPEFESLATPQYESLLKVA
ncbi:EAL domain-containing protein (putative c-di-GMP-specific phosphodiesterase class I) [Rhizobium soli]|uniref:EAL domain-containing protein (Putative c-di-GMP-specific phosphodiesterase class I) n=1 Tax=Rhizobium soli TaxID=424798 RepID=A0A7X0JMZ8_9HYPH|nr:EAL domain-containing protein [Rhizobium soli]MBB6510563.1 EAL domain-containing protein (putative c-di-GMP-specific phosphodiesterase class I) [Rhizobium soli]